MKTPYLTRSIPAQLLIMLLCFCPFMGQSQTSSSNAENTQLTVYKFSIENVIDQVDADQVIQSLLSNVNFTSANFIDEADCFKVTTNQPVSYEMLKVSLADEGFILSDKVLLSDGTIIQETTELIERN